MADTVQIENELSRVVERSLGADRVVRTLATHYTDHAGEPALSIAVTMKRAEDIPNAAGQSELTHRLKEELARFGDRRFPYLYVDALDLDRSDEDEDEFDSAQGLEGGH